MIFVQKFDVNDPLGFYRRYSFSQRFIEPGMAILLGSGIIGGTSLAGGLLGGKTEKPKLVSTFSRSQKNMDRYLQDFILGIVRNSKGQEISRKPLLQQAYEKKMPMMRTAPKTDHQKMGLEMATNLLGRVQNAKRPDSNYVSNLARGILPGDKNPRYAALGAKLLPGERAIVGEDGTEVVQVNPDGTVTVIPNPESVSSPKNMAEAMGKSAREKKRLGIPKGFATGTGLTSRKKFGDYYLPEYAPNYSVQTGQGDRWGTYSDQPWTSDVRKAYEDTWNTTSQNEKWYDYFQNTYGGDISKIGSEKKLNAANNPVKWGAGTKEYQILDNYYQGLNSWWNQQESVTGNQGVADALGNIGVGTDEEFRDWWTNQDNNKYYDPTNDLVWRGGTMDFDDPYSVDMANLSKSIEDYKTWYTSEQGPGYEAPAATDYSQQLGQLDSSDYDTAFNDFLKTYKGGSLKDSGIKYNPKTGQYEMYAPDGYEAGMTQAVSDFNAQKAEAASTPPTETTMAESMTGSDEIDAYIESMTEALQGYTKPFNSDSANNAFRKSYYDPAMKEFEEKQRPSIREGFAGGDLFSSARQKAEEAARSDLESQLVADQENYVFQAEQDHKNRALSAMGVGLSLAQLPATLANTKASTEHTRAAAASLFADIETQNALVNAQLDNNDLSMLVTLMNIFDTEQQQIQSEWNTAFQNLLSQDKLNTTDLLNLLMGYQDQSQIAYV